MEIQVVTPYWTPVDHKPMRNGTRVVEIQTGIRTKKTKNFRGSYADWITEMGAAVR